MGSSRGARLQGCVAADALPAGVAALGHAYKAILAAAAALPAGAGAAAAAAPPGGGGGGAAAAPPAGANAAAAATPPAAAGGGAGGGAAAAPPVGAGARGAAAGAAAPPACAGAAAVYATLDPGPDLGHTAALHHTNPHFGPGQDQAVPHSFCRSTFDVSPNAVSHVSGHTRIGWWAPICEASRPWNCSTV